MSFAVGLCKKINKLFPLPVHPFNLSNSGIKTYSEWQFEKGSDTIKFYLDQTNTDKMFKDKIVLDIGCGAGGKSIYYASLGAQKVYGVEILEKYRADAEKIASQKGFEDRFTFVCEDAAHLGFESDSIDTIVMNDAMEHVNSPIGVLNECYRVLKPGGRLYLNFPPYNHPFGAHLSDAIGIPWVHCFFSDRTLIKVYKDLVNGLPDGKQRIEFRIAEIKGEEYFCYINKISIKKFHKVLEQSKLKRYYYSEVPLRNILRPIAKFTILREYTVKMVVCILGK